MNTNEPHPLQSSDENLLPNPDLDFQEGDILPTWEALQLDGSLKVLILSDIHLPYHRKDPLMLALKHGRKNDVDVVLLNGDTIDFYQLSRFNKDPRARNAVEEIKLTREFLAYLRSYFPKARIIFKMGNHDERYDLHMQKNSPELIGLDTFEFANVIQLDKFGIEMVRDSRVVRLGKLNVIHGHEYRFAISNPVSPARGLFLRTMAYSMCAHFHQKTEHSENTIEGKPITTWSTGCLCDLHPMYARYNKWSNGFAFVEVFNDNKFHVINMRVSQGKIY